MRDLLCLARSVVAALALWTLTGCCSCPPLPLDEHEGQTPLGGPCQADDDCALVTIQGASQKQTCLTQYIDGYCSIRGCADRSDCPTGSVCVLVGDDVESEASRYCFVECTDQDLCKENRGAENAPSCEDGPGIQLSDSDPANLKACFPKPMEE